MCPARRGFHQARGSSRRRTGWEEGPGGTSTQSLTTAGITLIGSGAQILQDGHTLVRTRGWLGLILATNTLVGDGVIGAFGIGIVSKPAFDIGITAIPGPLSEMDWEGWLYFRHFSVRSGDVSAGFTQLNGVMAGIEVDSKAMRKVGTDEVVIAVIEHVLIGTADVRVNFDSRALYKLA